MQTKYYIRHSAAVRGPYQNGLGVLDSCNQMRGPVGLYLHVLFKRAEFSTFELPVYSTKPMDFGHLRMACANSGNRQEEGRCANLLRTFALFREPIETLAFARWSPLVKVPQFSFLNRSKLAKKRMAAAEDPRARAVHLAQEFQTAHNFWPEPVRRPGTTHSCDEHSWITKVPGTVLEFAGSAPRPGHKFDTHVAAIDGASSHLFLVGDAHFGEGTERRTEVMCLHLDGVGVVDHSRRYIDFFEADSAFLREPVARERRLCTAISAPITSSPSDPNDDARMGKMRSVLAALAEAWAAGPGPLEAVERQCALGGCALSFPIQRLFLDAPGEFKQGWAAGAVAGFGDYARRGSRMHLSYLAAAGHHPVCFAQFDVEGAVGVLVAQFDPAAAALLKVVAFRDFSSAGERARVFKPPPTKAPPGLAVE